MGTPEFVYLESHINWVNRLQLSQIIDKIVNNYLSFATMQDSVVVNE